MENSSERWGFAGNKLLLDASAKTLRSTVGKVADNVNKDDPRPVLSLGHGDPSVYPLFRTTIDAEDPIVEAVRSGNYNSYAASAGLDAARSAVAEYLNRHLSYKLTMDDVYLTVGCNQGIEIILSVLTRPGANILFPRPGFPHYEARAVASRLEVRHFDLLSEKDWEVDLDAVEELADENTVAMVIINPNNPCGNVYSYDHLKKIAETAQKLGIMVISDEVYEHLVYGTNPFIPMGTFAKIVPVFTLGSTSKGWFTAGWRIGWMATHDPYGVFTQTGVIDSLKACLDIVPDPTTFLQAALPDILKNTKEEFFEEKNLILKKNVDFAADIISEIPSLTVVKKPESCTYILVKLNLSLLESIEDDMDFCLKLAYEEVLIVLPGQALLLDNWIRITIGADPSVVEDAFARLKAFCERHAKKPEALIKAVKIEQQ